MRESYERTYQKYLRFRYLVPLFFLGNGGGLQRLVHQTDFTSLFVEEHETAEIQGFQRIQGEIRNHKVFALRGPDQIEVSPHNPASVYNTDLVSFYLGFTIRGPVAYNIRYVKKSAQFVDKHKKNIIERVEKVDLIINDLRPMIPTEQYSTIMAASTNNAKMEKLYSILSAGYEIKDTFYQSLLKNEQGLIQDLTKFGKKSSN
ncbi:sterile alpha motif domain-containing 9-like protein [Labeo rohita]|uniref:Sterile alpha motif domain-containing 9-like protein n=1 Tax=Labeo rohita TaxID=84645 RepID=A0A498NLQ5_LABRO|nr:sterile alpha motif domain-containing 9-like protein [Labeo rohita]